MFTIGILIVIGIWLFPTVKEIYNAISKRK